MTLVVDTFKSLLPPRIKRTPSGWLSLNAPCCMHRGHKRDTRSRGGVRFDNGISFHCFNCHFTTGWQPGRPLSFNFKQMCLWLGAEESVINKMIFEALKTEADDYTFVPSTADITFETAELPYNSEKISTLVDNNIPQHDDFFKCIKYLIDRGFDPTDENFYWSEEISSRVIIPFFHNHRIVGHTARKVGAGKPKYLNDKPANYVFNLDKQSLEQKYIIVCEGPFDAISIGGVSLLTNVVSDKQGQLINSYGAEVIVVPDQDSAGLELVDQVIKNNWDNWAVAFPNWDDDVNDVADAVNRYGKLFVLVDIIKTAAAGQIKLKVARNQFEHKIKRIEHEL